MVPPNQQGLRVALPQMAVVLLWDRWMESSFFTRSFLQLLVESLEDGALCIEFLAFCFLGDQGLQTGQVWPCLYDMECSCTGCCFRPKLPLSVDLYQARTASLIFDVTGLPELDVWPRGVSSIYEQCLYSFSMEKCGLLVSLPTVQERHKKSSRVPGALWGVHEHAAMPRRGWPHGTWVLPPRSQDRPPGSPGMQCAVHEAECGKIAHKG